MLNNVGYAMAVEKLLGIDKQIPERAQYIRVIVGEISRITDHLTCLGASAHGARRVHRRSSTSSRRASGCSSCSRRCRGARLTHSYVRIGGVADDLPDGFDDKLARHPRARSRERDGRGRASCSTSNRIFRDRMDGIGIITQEDALAYGITGPCARSTGVAYDVRKDHPYLGLRPLRLRRPGRLGRRQLRPLPRARRGDAAVDAHPRPGAGRRSRAGPVMVDDPRIALPPKSETYNTIEAMIAPLQA